MNKKEMIIKPELENLLIFDNCKQNLYDLDKAEKINIKLDAKNRYFLFNFGMLFAYLHYFNPKKNINLIETPEKTDYKSFNNVLLDIIKGVDLLPPYEINEKKAFLISPVRKAEDPTLKKLIEYKNKLLETSYNKVHFPYHDTNQEDPIGTRICRDNLKAEASSGTIKIFYKDDSFGSVFDLGMDFMLKYFLDSKYCPNKKRKIELINKQDIKSKKGYKKLLLELTEKN